jgi:toxin ParE1/3/4
MVVHKTYVVIYTEGKAMISVLRVLHGAQQWPPEHA